MWRIAPLLPMVAFTALLACAKQDPVDENAVAPPDTSLAAPANAAAAEAARRAALPAASDLSWTYHPASRSALFGPKGVPAFSIQCSKPREGENQLLFVRFLPPTSGGSGTLSFTGNGHVASVPIAAVINPDGLGGQWRATVSAGDMARDVAETFAGLGPVDLSITGLAPLVVPSTAQPRRVFAECLG